MSDECNDGLGILPTIGELRAIEAARRAADPDYDFHEALRRAVDRAERVVVVPLAGRPWSGL